MWTKPASWRAAVCRKLCACRSTMHLWCLLGARHTTPAAKYVCWPIHRLHSLKPLIWALICHHWVDCAPSATQWSSTKVWSPNWMSSQTTPVCRVHLPTNLKLNSTVVVVVVGWERWNRTIWLPTFFFFPYKSSNGKPNIRIMPSCCSLTVNNTHTHTQHKLKFLLFSISSKFEFEFYNIVERYFGKLA